MIGGAKAAQDWSEWEGQIIDGKFPLLRYLGCADRNAVFLTERPEGEPRTTAIKLVPANDITVEAVLARWMAAARLSHPGLLRIFEIGRGSLGHVEFAYLVMEYAEEDLAQVDRPLTEAEAGDSLERMLPALAYLHGQQLAHGHLKPSNILAIGDQLKLSTDTIRPAGEWRSNLDAPGLCDPPEIAREGASPAGDIWSLGVTLVAALTKQMPSFDQGALAESLLDRLPARFRVPVSNCLRFDPQERWTAAQLAEWFRPEAVSSGEEVPLVAATEQPRPKLPARRFLLPAAAVGLALLATVIVSRFTSDRAEGARPVVVEPKESNSAPVASLPKPEEVQSPSRIVITQVMPDVPAKARNTIHGKVTVNIRVGVDANGSVVETRNESPRSSRFFGNLALKAAGQWKFAPVAPNGSTHPEEWNLHFQFLRDPQHPVAVKAVPAR